jgi:hypothetical protein
VGTLHGLPILFALTGAKAVDREVLAELLAMEPDLVAARCWAVQAAAAADRIGQRHLQGSAGP